MAKAPALQAGYRGFESLLAHSVRGKRVVKVVGRLVAKPPVLEVGCRGVLVPGCPLRLRQTSCKNLVFLVPWCRGLTCLPVTQKIAGSNPVGTEYDDRRGFMPRRFFILVAKPPVLEVGYRGVLVPGCPLRPRQTNVLMNILNLVWSRGVEA